MKHFLITLALLSLNVIPLSAETIEEQVAYIGECLDDVSRLEEGRQLLQQMLNTKNIRQQAVYPQLLYLQIYYHINTGDIARSKQELLALQDILPAKGFDELSISVPQNLGVCYHREAQLRIVQEYVANIIKDGTATHVNISLAAGRLTIEDDGKPTPPDEQGIGQRTIHDRALSIGATISTKKEYSHNLLAITFNP